MSVLRRPHIGPHSSVRTPNKAFTGGAAPGGFDPTSIAGLQEWFKADAGTSTLVNGAAISQWNDQSGNARHLTQPTGAQQPTLQTNVHGSLSVVRFAAAGPQWMSGVAGTFGAAGVSFVVLSLAAIAAEQQVLSSSHDLFIGTNVSKQWDMYQGAELFSGTSTTAWGVVTARFNGDATSSLRRDGAVLVTGNAGALTQATATLNVGRHPSVNRPLGGDIGEILIYSGSLSGTDVANVEAYLKAKWGTP